MNINEYYYDFLLDVDIENSESGEGRSAVFTKQYLDKLINYEKIEEYNFSYFESITTRGRKLRIDAYYYDEVEDNLNLYVTDFCGKSDIERITFTDIKTIFDRLIAFIELAYAGKLDKYVDISDRIYSCIEEIKKKYNIIKKYKLNIITDKILSDRVSVYESNEVSGKAIEYNIWDINRIFLLESSKDIDEDYIVNFGKYGVHGLEFITLNQSQEHEIKSYLGIIPGEVLANIFDEYGSKILESNVRSFLSFKGKVNAGIRATILNENEKKKFFAYNNGISITASKVITENIDGNNYIIGLERMQIVNGGQTTASLSNARFRDKASLEGIFLQVKITEINDEQKDEIVRNISKYSNSQNKVTDADFYSTSPFAVRMEQLSRRIFAPATNGNQHETQWFYERAKGQYFLAQTKLATADLKSFLKRNPKNQLLTKANIGTYRNIWECRPHIAKKGAENSLKYFVDKIGKLWDANNLQFNEVYFKETVAIGILYRKLNKAILKEKWYKFGYAAEVTIYTLSLISYMFGINNKHFDLLKIWNQQNIDDKSFAIILELAEKVYLKICDDKREISNISEWCKKEACWNSVKQVDFDIKYILENYSVSSNIKKDIIKDAKEDMKFDNDIQRLSKIISAGSQFWKDLSIFALSKNILNEKEMSILAIACRMDYKTIPSEKQAIVLEKVYEKCILEGYDKILESKEVIN